jgi:hypothetical protein
VRRRTPRSRRREEAASHHALPDRLGVPAEARLERLLRGAADLRPAESTHSASIWLIDRTDARGPSSRPGCLSRRATWPTTSPPAGRARATESAPSKGESGGTRERAGLHYEHSQALPCRRPLQRDSVAADQAGRAIFGDEDKGPDPVTRLGAVRENPIRLEGLPRIPARPSSLRRTWPTSRCCHSGGSGRRCAC